MKNLASFFTQNLTLICSLVLVLVLVGTIDFSYAQPPGLPDAPSQAPIDGGLSILAIGAGAYGLKKLKSMQKK